MPSSINGLQLYQRIKAMNKDIKVLFLTALDAVDELVSVIPEVEKRHVVKKPIEKDAFITRVKECLSPSSLAA